MAEDIFQEKKAFNFYRSYYETSLLLDGDDKLEYIESILHYQFTGELIEPKSKFALLAFKGQIHSLNKQVIGYVKGKSGTINNPPPIGSPPLTHPRVTPPHPRVQVQVQEKVQVEVKEKEEIILTPTAFSMYRSLLDFGADKILINDWLKVRKTKKATNTETALKSFLIEVEKSKKNINEILKICIENSWSGFRVNWLENLNNENGRTNNGYNPNGKNGNSKVSGTQNLIDGLEYFEFT